MTQRSTQILEEALSLPAKDRAELVEQILSSLNLSPPQEIDQLWAREAEDRLDAFERNKIGAISAKEVFEGISKRKKT